MDALGREPWRTPIPRARIEPAPVVPEGGTASLLATGTDPDGAGLTFDWDMDGDGTYELTGLGNPSATFSAAGIDGPGSRVVRVRATDATGVAAIDEATVLVINVAPTVEAGPAVTLDPGQALARPGTFSDPGLDSWTATVDYGDGPGPQPLPLSGKAFTLAHAYASRRDLHPASHGAGRRRRVGHGDGDGDGGRLPQGAIQSLIEEVEGLIDDGTLKLGQGKSLVGKLELALYMLEWGNTKKAITMLEAFIHEVRAFKNAGILEPGQADEMIRVAEAAIAVSRGLKRRSGRGGPPGPRPAGRGSRALAGAQVPPAEGCRLPPGSDRGDSHESRRPVPGAGARPGARPAAPATASSRAGGTCAPRR